MTIALHACCGPCLIEPLESLATEDEVVVVYANPNIAPREEYERRRDTLREHVRTIGAKFVELPYDPGLWRQAVAGLEGDPPRRCAACYRLRLGMTATWAAEQGIEHLASTLTVSPYQDADSIREAGEEVASQAGVSYLDRDFRDRYPAATSRAREMGLYRQNYCGCPFSYEEAEQARAKRRAERASARRGRQSVGDG